MYLKVINLDSKIVLTDVQISFVESILFSELFFFNRGLRIDLASKIPIFLLSPVNMPGEIKLINNEFKNKEIDHNEISKSINPTTEWLGFYDRSFDISGIKIPVIGLCLERIIKIVNNENELNALIAKVIIHEFAHAIMDLDEHYDGHIDEFHLWMEESLANYITLMLFDEYSSYLHKKYRIIEYANIKPMYDPFCFVENFISKQPDNYRLGLDFFQHKLWGVWIWSSEKSITKDRVKEKQAWLNYVKQNVGDIESYTLQKLFCDVLDNYLYYEEYD